MRVAPPIRRALVLFLVAASRAVAPAVAQQKPTLTVADYAQWESIGVTELSPDGRWFAYTINRVDADDELRVREVATDSTVVVRHGTRPVFSSDGRWLAYGMGVSRAEQERLDRENQPSRSRFGLLDLHTGATTVIDDIATYEFSADAGFIALRAYAPQHSTGAGADVIVRDLAVGTHTSLGNVAASAWRDSDAVLALIVDADNRAGNGVRVYDARAGTLRTLESDTASYTGLVWREAGDDIAVLRVLSDERYEEKGHTVLAWRNVSAPHAARHVLAPERMPSFPDGQRIVDVRELKWSADGAALIIGTRPWTQRPAPASDSAVVTAAAPAGVEVWHSKDIDIVPEQKVRAGIERNRSLAGVWHLATDRYVQLSRELTEDVSLSDGRYALVVDNVPYGRDRMFGATYRDLYAVDMASGTRAPIARRVQFHYGISPTGRYVIWVRDGHYWTFDTHTGRSTNITQHVPATFINVDDDHTVTEKPPFGAGGWTAGDRTVLLHDRYDVWEVQPAGGHAVNLTNGAADRVVHRRVWLDPDHRIVDTSKPVYVTLYGERTKQYGYAAALPGGGYERLVFTDAGVTRLTRARAADVFFYRVEAFDDSPDYVVGGPRLAGARQVTNTNPFQSRFAWGRTALVDFTSADGQELQAALLYPAHYEAGRVYPMIVFPYEITSNTIHTYYVPTETSPINPTVFTQHGYFVLRPDIRYRARNPGLSAVAALTAAVEKVTATGMIDRERIGIIGHSWGAYQAAFVITQTDMFRAAVAGAPLTNLISMYGSVFWSAGVPDAKIFETGQARMEVPFWEDMDTYIRNSPLYHVQRMNTPLLVAFGDEDGAVDWNQGVELYNAARRAGKDMVLLVYEGEYHSLSRKPNQIDYHRRINEWFAHYLRDAPAPAWMRIEDHAREGLLPEEPAHTLTQRFLHPGT